MATTVDKNNQFNSLEDLATPIQNLDKRLEWEQFCKAIQLRVEQFISDYIFMNYINA